MYLCKEEKCSNLGDKLIYFNPDHKTCVCATFASLLLLQLPCCLNFCFSSSDFVFVCRMFHDHDPWFVLNFVLFDSLSKVLVSLFLFLFYVLFNSIHQNSHHVHKFFMYVWKEKIERNTSYISRMGRSGFFLFCLILIFFFCTQIVVSRPSYHTFTIFNFLFLFYVLFMLN